MTPLHFPQITASARDRHVRFLSLAAGLILAATQANAAAVLVHDYQLDGDLSDTLGGPDLISEGGTIGAASYAFGPNQGLSLIAPSLTDLGSYSIEMRVSLDFLIAGAGSPWIKLIDFKNKSSDAGLYSFDGESDGTGSILQFYPFGGTSDTFTPGAFANVVITRDGTTKEVVTYAEGFGQFSFIDSLDDAVFSNSIIRFMQDDTVVPGETGYGSIDYIRIYDSVLTADEVAGGGVPDGGTTLAMLAFVMTGIAAVRRKMDRV